MSMLSHQIEQLKDLQHRMKTSDKHNPTDWNLINGAIDTIESLSAKLSVANMERSERYYGGGWIACESRLPQNSETGIYDMQLVTLDNGDVCLGVYRNDDKEWLTRMSDGETLYTNEHKVLAWQPLLQPYKPNKE